MNNHENDRFPRMLADEPDADELEAVWSALEATRTGDRTSPEKTDAAWEALSGKLGLGAADAPVIESEHHTSSSPAATRTGWLRVAAVAAVVLGGAAVWQQVPVTHIAPAGERVAVTLPDGSDVQLNAGSILRHRRGFNLLPGVAADARSVRLDGEAFFDVEPGERPFEVEAGEARVTVLGTRFNVRARAGLGAPVRVEVAEGRVRVEAEPTDCAVELEAGQSVFVVSGSNALVPESIPVDRIASWRSGGLSVSEEPLAEVVTELGVRFGVNVALAASVDGSVRVTAYYPLVTGVESVLTDLATQQNLQVRRTADGWELF
ncbi:MAG: FecR domain-containing protein [Gemmatimonadota bacterium]